MFGQQMAPLLTCSAEYLSTITLSVLHHAPFAQIRQPHVLQNIRTNLQTRFTPGQVDKFGLSQAAFPRQTPGKTWLHHGFAHVAREGNLDRTTVSWQFPS